MGVSQDSVLPYDKVQGQFQEKTYKRYFDYTTKLLSDWDKEHDFTHRVFVGNLGETRPAIVKKTVAYVCTDIDDNGCPVIERWYIKRIWDRNDLD